MIHSAGLVTTTAPDDRQPLATLECVVLDCPDPRQLAAFYHSLLGGSINQPDPRWTVGDRWASLHTPGAEDRVLAFGDKWLPQSGPLADMAEFRRRVTALRERAALSGRGPTPVTVSGVPPVKTLLAEPRPSARASRPAAYGCARR